MVTHTKHISTFAFLLLAVGIAPRFARGDGPADKGQLVAQADEKRKAGDTKGALDLYKQARKLGGDDPAILLSIAVTAYNAQEFAAGREALDAYLNALPDKSKDKRIIEFRAALEKGCTAPAQASLTANQRLAIRTVGRMVQDLLTAQENQQNNEALRLAESIHLRLEDIQRSGAGEDLALWRTTGILAVATKDADLAAWATEALLRLAGDDWDKDPQLAELLPRVNALAKPAAVQLIQEERAFLLSLQSKYSNEHDRSSALLKRGNTYSRQGDAARAIVDYTQTIVMKGISVELVAMALNNRGIAYAKQGDAARAMIDYTQTIGMKDAPADPVARALLGRADIYLKRNEATAAVADYTQIIGMKDAPAGWVAEALCERAKYYDQNLTGLKIVDYSTVIGMKDAPAKWVASALFDRGYTYRQQDDAALAIADYTQIIDMKDAPDDLKDAARQALSELRK
jgi:tetratricopeptide (TPR) repeat protein